MRGLLASLRDNFACVAVSVSPDGRCLPQPLRRALRCNGFTVGTHASDGCRESLIRQSHALDAYLADVDSIHLEHSRSDLLAKLLFEGIQSHLPGIDVDQVGQIEIAGDDMQRCADVAPQLTRRLVRLITDGTEELAHARRVARHLPCDVGLDEHAQSIARSYVLQAC